MEMESSIEKRWRVKLEEALVEGVAEFVEKVRNNAGVPENTEDFLCEARAALMFREHGFSVKMRDRPDLELGYCGIRFFAEVKHFRFKTQDSIDEARLEEAGRQALEDDFSILTPYGDTQATEGKPVWRQLVDVARRKVNQYCDGYPNILVIFSSSSHCVEDADFNTAACAINCDVAYRKTPGLEKLSGLLLVTKWMKVPTYGHVYFARIYNSAVPLPQKLCGVLSAIRRCKWAP